MKTTSPYLTDPRQLALAALLLAFTVMAGCQPGEAEQAETIETLSKKAAPLSQAEQDDLARAVFATLARADDSAEPEYYERHYKMVMDKCPDTKQAHESYWRLTNLYRLAYDEPKLEEIVEILEQFLGRYKTSTVVSMSKYPDELLVFSPLGSLHRAYEELGQYDKIAAYYDKIAAQEASFSVQDYFDYATALDETDRSEDAVTWYKKFLKKAEGNEGMEFTREIAEDRVAELEQK